MLAGDGLARICFIPKMGGLADAPILVDGPPLVPDAPGGAAKLSANQQGLDFGAVVAGMPSIEQTIVLSNAGNATSGMLDWNKAGPDPDDFTITGDSCKGATLTAGGSCTISLTFNPGGAGSRSATLGVVAQPGGLVLASLGGSGLAAGPLSIAPATQDFGTALEGADGGEFAFTVRNTAETASGTVGVSLFHGSDYALTASGCSGALAGAASCTVKVRFSPRAAALAVDSLVATDGNGSAAALLVGHGLADAHLVVTPGSLDFGTLSLGAHTAPMDFTVRNAGGTLSGAPMVMLSDPTQFTIAANGCTAPLAPAASCTVSVAFAPADSAGAKSATLTAAATPGGTASSSLSGTALGSGTIGLTPGDHAYGAVALGSQSGEVLYEVRNGGGTDVGPLSVSVMGTAATSFMVSSNDCPGALGAGASCHVGVTFAPEGVGALAATLAVGAGAAGSAATSLSGSGTASLTVTRNGAGTVTSDPLGISCGATCAASFGSSPVTLSASADPLNDFGGWSGAGCSGTGPCVVTLDGAKTVTANFTVRPPALTVGPTSQDFGSATLGSASTPVTFTVQNGGGAASGPVSAGVSDMASYTVTGGTCLGQTVAAGGSCTVIVKFNPTGSAGSKLATLTVSATPGGPATASLTGTALSVGNLMLGPGAHDFMTLARGSASAETLFTVTNSGQSAAGTLGASLSDATNFTISSNNCPTTLGAGASCMVGVKFTPASVGAKSGSLTVSASPGGSTALSVSGTGSAQVSVSNSGGGTVMSDDGKISCGATCMATFTASPVNLTAVADGTHTFGSWGGACSGTGACSVTLDAASKSVSASFNGSNANLSVTSLTDAPDPVQVGSNMTYSIIAHNAGPGTSTGTTLTDAIASTVTFVSATPSQGSCNLAGTTITCVLGTMSSGQDATVTVVVTAGQAGSVSNTAAVSGGASDPDTTDNMKATTTTVNPAGILLSVAFTGSGAGTVMSAPAGISCSSACNAGFTSGTMVTLTATPMPGSYFQGWASGDCSGSRRFCTLTMTAAKSATAKFTPQTYNTVFVSSATYTGNLGGLAGADMKCNQLASTAGLSGSYVALLSDTTHDAIDRLGSARGFVRVDGAPFADDIAGLFGPTYRVFNALDLDENGAVVNASSWTETGLDGRDSGVGDCGGWMTTSSDSSGAGSTVGGPARWATNGPSSCVSSRHLYCFMTDKSVPLSPTPTAGKRIFVTNSSFIPNGGVAAANAACESSKPSGAAAVVALLATTTIPASTLLNPSTTYVRIDGQLVGTGQEILNGAIHSGPWQQGNGSYFTNDAFWAGSSVITAAGTPDGTCNDWSMISSSNGVVANANLAVGGLFGTIQMHHACGEFDQEVLLCIEQ